VARQERGDVTAAPASGAASEPATADAMPPDAPARVVITAVPVLYPIEPVVERDFALLRVQYAVAKRSAPEIVAAVDALGEDRGRPVMLARADAAIGRAAARDSGSGPALQRETEALQTWVAEHPRDALAWALLAQCAEPLGEKLRAIRAEAEAHAANGDLLGAIDRLHAGQRLTRTGRLDFVEASIIDSRLHELEADRRALGKDLHDADHP
jgi:hypothetical protein